MKRQEDEKQSESEKQEMARIKRAFLLKKKLAAQNNAQLSSVD